MKTLIGVVAFVLVIAFVAVCRYFISPMDVLTGRDRVVAKCELPNGDRIEVLQYWNHGDFYNLDLSHITTGGAEYSCVIDPDCNRIPRCEVEIDAASGEAIIKAGGSTLARYRWAAKELLRRNGVLVEALPMQGNQKVKAATMERR